MLLTCIISSIVCYKRCRWRAVIQYTVSSEIISVIKFYSLHPIKMVCTGFWLNSYFSICRFCGSVKLKGIIIIGGEDDMHPSKMKMYKNTQQSIYNILLVLIFYMLLFCLYFPGLKIPHQDTKKMRMVCWYATCAVKTCVIIIIIIIIIIILFFIQGLPFQK